ncbi:hypothetical protein B0H66DRAFT_226457 [Apodospora peruviana]|uniref:Uncharacterized protein n=1 Tax=Apodospora peruviana TaxID=516989 RepID=A0AAE0M3X4_9PEZI|nr:hypothetical protein B0H66DRAFT_226457 [Apodospora peruviana]
MLLISLGGMTLVIALQQTREPSCEPDRSKIHTDDGFWIFHCQIFLQFLSAYCTLYPTLIRGRGRRSGQIAIARTWLGGLLATSVVTSVVAAIIYPWSWKISAVLGFVSAFTANVSAAQLAVGINTSG